MVYGYLHYLRGISSVQLAQDIHVTQKTAWFILHKLRRLYSQNAEVLVGKVEMDGLKNPKARCPVSG